MGVDRRPQISFFARPILSLHVLQRSTSPPTRYIYIHIWGRLFRLNLARKLPEDGIAVPTVPINKESLFTYAATRRESEEYIGSTYMSIN